MLSGILLINIPKLAVFMKKNFKFSKKYGVLIGRKIIKDGVTSWKLEVRFHTEMAHTVHL